MKKILVLLSILANAAISSAYNYTSVKGGNWNDTTVWTGGPSGTYPHASDTATITTAGTVYSNVGAIGRTIINSGATLQVTVIPYVYGEVINNGTVNGPYTALDFMSSNITVVAGRGIWSGAHFEFNFGGVGQVIDSTVYWNNVGYIGMLNYNYPVSVVNKGRIIMVNYNIWDARTNPVTWTNAKNSFLKLSNYGGISFANAGDTLYASAQGDTVEYWGSGTGVTLKQPAGGKYYNLILTGATTLPSNLTVTKLFEVASSATANLNGYNMTIDGDWINNGTITNNTGTVTFNGSANQTVSGSGSIAFYNLTQNQAASTDTVFLTKPATVSNTLTTTQGILDCEMHQLTNSATPVVGLSPSSATICAGSSTTLRASNYTTYIWTPSTGLSATTGDSVTANPVASTTYTVYGNSSHTHTCGISLDTVTVNPTPTISVTASATAICQGDADTLTASGANTYTWAPATGLNTTTGATVTSSPTVTTTYTVSGTNSSGCVYTQSLKITVNPLPTLTITASASAICNGSTDSLTASGANTYTWAPATGLSTTTGASVLATPTTNTTYAVTGTSAIGCVNSVIDTIKVNNCGPGYSCSDAIALDSIPVNLIDSAFAQSTKWYSFIADSGSLKIIIVNFHSNQVNVTNVNLYTSCDSSPIAFASVKDSMHDSLVIQVKNLVMGNKYYLSLITPKCIPCINIHSLYDVTLKKVTPFGPISFPTAGGTIHTWEGCGINYVMASIPIHERYHGGSCVAASSSSPFNLPITLPIGAFGSNIQAAYLIWCVVGLDASNSGPNSQSFTLTPPIATGNTPHTFNATYSLGGYNGNATCWYSYINQTTNAYITDVTSYIQGLAVPSGNYVITGLPYNNPDADGATLIVVYKDPCATYNGSFTLATGFDIETGVLNQDPYEYQMAIPNQLNFSGKAFFIAGDIEDCTGNEDTYGINTFNTPNNFTVPTANMWGAEVSSVTFSGGQNTIDFAINNGDWDCFDMIATGVYSQGVTGNLPCDQPSASASPYYICAGNNSTLTVNGGNSSYTWVWSPASGLTSSTGTSVSASPTTTTTYTVNAYTPDGILIPCESPTVQVKVDPLPTFTIMPINPSVCNSAPVTLTTNPSTGYSYTWTPSTGLNSSTGSSVIANPTTATIYNVTAFDGSCSSTENITVNVGANPIISITPNGNTSFCAGSSVDLNASGAGTNGTYTWSPNIGLTPSTGINVTASPTSLVTYTVTGTTSIGCSGTATISINATSTCCFTDCDAAIGSNPYTGGLVIKNGTTSSSYGGFPVITSPTCDISSSKASVNIQGVFYIDNNCILRNCNVAMSSNAQIIVKNGGTLEISSARLFACGSMWQGIIVQQGGILIVDQGSIIEDAEKAIEGAGGTITLTGTTLNNVLLNNNYQDIYIDPYSGSGLYPLSMQEVTLTTSTDGTFSGPGLKTPHLGRITYSGVYLQNVQGGGIQIGNYNGGNLTNTFSNMNYGIGAYNSNFYVYNNNFNNLAGFVPKFPSPGTPTGIAIAGIASSFLSGNPLTWFTAVIGGNITYQKNTFTNCYWGVYIRNYVFTTVTDNTFSNTSDLFPSFPNKAYYGDHAIYVRIRYAQTLELNNNSITNCRVGIHLLRQPPVSGYSYLEDINYNDIVVNSPSICNTGILAENTFRSIFAPLNIENNIIHYANVCIWTRNFSDNITNIVNNQDLEINGNTKYYTVEKTGIRVENCWSGINVIDNIIHSPNTYISTTAAPADTDVLGINLELSPENVVQCNTMYDVGECMRFTHYCYNTRVISNIMTTTGHNCYDGFVLWNSGIIGKQGSTGYPIGDIWYNPTTNFLRSHTYTWQSNAKYSELWVSSGSATDPTNNQGLPTFGQYTSAYITTTSGTAPSCGGTCYTCRSTDSTSIMDRIALDSMQYAIDSTETQYINKQIVFSTISQDTGYLAIDSVLHRFYDSTVNTNIGKIYNIENSISNGNYDIQGTINGLVPANNLEQNHKTVDSLYVTLERAGIDTLDSLQFEILYNVANQCPDLGGLVVYNARSMLNWFTDNYFEFSDSCAAGGSHRSVHIVPGNQNKQLVNNNAKVYPNPANSLLNVEVKLAKGTNDNICLYNAEGQRVICETLTSNISKLAIENLPSGIYLYRITDVSGKLIKTDKVMIVH